MRRHMDSVAMAGLLCAALAMGCGTDPVSPEPGPQRDQDNTHVLAGDSRGGAGGGTDGGTVDAGGHACKPAGAPLGNQKIATGPACPR